MKSLHSMAALALASLIAGSTQAGSSLDETPSTVVNFADLNLHNSAGVAQLRARIRAAAREVCGSTETRDLNEAARVRACISASVARALAEVNAAALSRLASGPSALRTSAPVE